MFLLSFIFKIFKRTSYASMESYTTNLIQQINFPTSVKEKYRKFNIVRYLRF